MKTIEDRITDIMPKLEAIAYKYASRSLDTQEDLVQDMVAHILERSSTLDYADEAKYNDAYLCQAGHIVAWEAARKGRVFARYFDTWENGIDPLEAVPFGKDVEAVVIARLEAEEIATALEDLDEKQVTILSAWASGYSGVEIAGKLDITPSRVSQLKKEALAKLRYSLE